MDTKKCCTISVTSKPSIRELGVSLRQTGEGPGTGKHARTVNNDIVIDNNEPEDIGMCWGNLENTIDAVSSFILRKIFKFEMNFRHYFTALISHTRLLC